MKQKCGCIPPHFFILGDIMYIGIDCGTQGTKAIVLDSVQKKVIGVGYAKHELITQSNGRREQQPNWWIEALQQALQIALKQAKKFTALFT